MDIANKVKRMINEEIYKWKTSQKELSFELREEIKRLENICKDKGIAYKRSAKKRTIKQNNN